METKEIEEKVLIALDEIRPFLASREPYQRDWFNGAIPLILQAKSDISA